MSGDWQVIDTTTHQDHVIAHVLGTTVLGHFIFDEALHLVLDIGFIWTLYLDAQMSLLPHPVAMGDLDMEADVRAAITQEIESLIALGPAGILLLSDSQERVDYQDVQVSVPCDFRYVTISVPCEISDVSIYAKNDARRIVVTGNPGSLVLEASPSNRELKVQ